MIGCASRLRLQDTQDEVTGRSYNPILTTNSTKNGKAADHLIR